MRAYPADKTLSQYTGKRGGYKEWFNSHIHQTGNGTRRIVGVKCAEYKVSGKRCFDSDLGSLKVTDLSHQNTVRVLTEKCPECFLESHADCIIDRTLHQAFNIILYRVFGGEDFIFNLIDFTESRVERGGFTGTGRSGNQQDTVGQMDDFPEFRQNIFTDTEGIQLKVHH